MENFRFTRLLWRCGRNAGFFPFGFAQGQNDKQKQIPCGDDKQEGLGQELAREGCTFPPIAMKLRWMGHPAHDKTVSSFGRNDDVWGGAEPGV